MIPVTVKYRMRLPDVFFEMYKTMREYVGPAGTYRSMKADALRTSYGGPCIPRKRTRRYTADASRWTPDGRIRWRVG